MSLPTPANRFSATRWTLVLRARGDSAPARAALGQLCSAYYQPVVEFLRMEGRAEDAARELAHAFFAAFLEEGLSGVDSRQGKFRSYLLGALKHFLAKRTRGEATQRRGGSVEHEEISPNLADTQQHGPDVEFDRHWALTILETAFRRLEQEMTITGKEAAFNVLSPWLLDNTGLPIAAAAATLGLREVAARVALHRLRERFRELLRTEISQTLADDADIDDELDCLKAALRG